LHHQEEINAYGWAAGIEIKFDLGDIHPWSSTLAVLVNHGAKRPSYDFGSHIIK
jgi:hypothetical protein